MADSVRIELAGGTYALSAGPTALDITFAGPSLTLEAESGSPVLDGTHAVRVMAVSAASTVTVDGLEIENGSTAGLGGAIQNNGALTVKHSTISNNAAANGGGISSAAGSTLTVQDSTLSGNATSSVGGGGLIAFGTATIERSALVGNTAPTNGAGINVQPSGTVTVASSTIAGNTSGSLGGAFSNLGTLNVELSTIANNTASGGSAIATGNANVTFAADIIGAQASGGACDPANTAIVDGGYNLDTDGTCISSTTPATGSHNGTTAYGASTYAAVLDAYLADALANNGGTTQTFALLITPNPATSLADPAFAVVPPSFVLPTPVDGMTTACSLADQRGFVPLAGANCDIGSYLLQATTTALSAPATAVQNGSVTYTATVTPSPDGGTVAFNDGAGNPATTNCAAQPVTSGKATCTVSYAKTGDYSVGASFAGDDPLHSFLASASSGQTVTITATPASASAPTPAPTSQPTSAPKPAPVISGLKLNRRCVTSATIVAPANGRSGLFASFKLSEDATVTYTISRRIHSPSWQVCPRRGGTVPISFGQVSAHGLAGKKGAHQTTVATIASAPARNRLAPGTYMLTVTATTADGRRSALETIKFWVYHRRHPAATRASASSRARAQRRGASTRVVRLGG